MLQHRPSEISLEFGNFEIWNLKFPVALLILRLHKIFLITCSDTFDNSKSLDTICFLRLKRGRKVDKKY